MGLESATYVNQLIGTNPDGADNKSFGDDHLRMIKQTLLNSLPNIGGVVTATHAELSYMTGCTSSVQTQINNRLQLSGGTITGVVTYTVLPQLPTSAGTPTDAANVSYVTAAIAAASFPAISSATAQRAVRQARLAAASL